MLKRCDISRLNSGLKIGITFLRGRFLIQKVGTDSVIYANSEDIKILVQFPGNAHQLKRSRKSLKVEFRYSVPRE